MTAGNGKISGETPVAFVNGKVHTVDADNRIVDAALVVGERIRFAGDAAEVLSRAGTDAEVVDLLGRSLVPGFTENHLHVLETSIDAGWLDCSPNSVESIDDIVRLVAAAAEDREAGEWIFGWGFNEMRLREGRYPTRDDLDRVSPHHPVAIRHVESMSWTANTAALRRMGIEDTTPDPPGGRMLRDSEGAPLGPMWDNCRVQFIFPILPKPGAEELAGLFAQTLGNLNSMGITSVNDAGIVSADQVRAFQILRERQELSARIYLNLYVAYGSSWDENHPAHRMFVSGFHTGFGDDWLRIGPVVIGVDGGTGSRRSALFDPYSNSTDGYRGDFRVDREFLREFCREAQRRRFQIAAVAHGDHAISMTLDAFEDAMIAHPGPNLRHRLEHAYLWNEDLIDRAAQLGVVLSSQPPIMELYERENTLSAWGPERSECAFPYESCRRAGLIATGGSDCPLVTPRPMVGIDALVNRRLGHLGQERLAPGQALSVDEALRVYTHNGAFGDHAEKRWGSIEPGKLADMVILSEDISEINPARLAEVEVDRTYVGGRLVFERAL